MRMVSEPHDSTPELKRSILRAVYEENRRIDERLPSPPPRVRAAGSFVPALPAPRRRPAALVPLLLLLLSSLGYGIFTGIPKVQAGLLPAPRLSPDTSAAAARATPSRAGGDLKVAQLFGLGVRTIVIDPGHGGRDPGTSGPSGLREKDITLDVALMLRERLQRQGFRVLLTREADEKRSLRERVGFANEQRADLFVSIHVNYVPVEPVTGIETFYFGLEADEQTLRLAEAENHGSEYGMGDFKHMLEKAGNTLRLEESKSLAVSIQKSLYRSVRTQNGEAQDWGVKTAPFVVLLEVEMPSVLAEIACLNNPAEEERLGTAEYRQSLAASLEQGIVNYLKQRTTEQEPYGGATRYATREGQGIE